MHPQETFLRPEAHPPPAHGISSAFPSEVLEQVRRRVRLLALLILIVSGGGSSFAERQARARMIPATYAPAGGSP